MPTTETSKPVPAAARPRRARARFERDADAAAAVWTVTSGPTRTIHVLIASRAGANAAGAASADFSRLPPLSADARSAVRDRRSFLSWPEAEEFLRKQRVATVLRIAPADACALRPLTLPELESATPIDRGAIADALSILAETEGGVSGSVPWYQRGSGVLPRMNPAAREAALLGVLSSPADLAGEELADWQGGQWVPQPVALAALARVWSSTAADASGASPVLAVAVDTSDKNGDSASASIVAQGPSRSLARAVRLDARSDASRETSLGEALRETADAAGLADAIVSEHGAGSPGPVRWWCEGSSPDSLPSWVDDGGLALGALSIWARNDPAEQGLIALRAYEPVAETTLPERVLRDLSRPRRAAVVIACAVAALVLVPMASAWARLKYLEGKARDAKLEQRLSDAERRVGFYQLLRERRWPMSKLLAEIAATAPAGIEIEALELTPNEAISIRGRAEKPDLVASFRENLSKTRVFSQLATPSVESGDGVRFTITARVTGNAAMFDADWPNDYTQVSLGKKLFGDEWREPAIASAEQPEDDTSFDRPRRRGNGAASRSDGSSTTLAPSAAFVPPAPLSDADIAQMDKTTAMKEFGARKAAAARATDPEVKARLNAESEKARQRMLSAGSPTGGGR